ncbi:AraC family transcriptional regulator [Winogradskyella sp.]|uniref:helix-turn-helix domain-containing protein n=1 Tax=Winogradskyella sp. TaxID=1883156 RepID=UPI0026391792|nr:AraC family transcriptional regulator [Winogradskyella sp.]
MLENIYFIASFVGILMGFILISQLFKGKKSDFFIGIVVLTLGIELLFSWGVLSGYTNSPNAIPYWKLLNYLLLPPSTWLFIKYNTNDNFKLQLWHYSLFLPAIIAYGLELYSDLVTISLWKYDAWIWLTEYLPILGMLYVIIFFWVIYYKLHFGKGKSKQKKQKIQQLRLVLLMVSITLLTLLWLIFTFIGWDYYNMIEIIIISMFLGFTVLNFVHNQGFQTLKLEEKNRSFPNYNDEENVKLLKKHLEQNQPYLKPILPLKELALQLSLPPRYLSFLINEYLGKNYKEFINEYRVNAFLNKVQSNELNTKTILGLALECGFNSKSTFNYVFKNITGNSPKEYLNKYSK